MSTQPPPPLGHVTGWASEPAWSVSGSKIASGDALIGIAIGCSAAELICQSHNAEIAAVRAVAERLLKIAKRLQKEYYGCDCLECIEDRAFLAELDQEPEGGK